MYFGNLCLRFLPVFDLLIHRFLELPALAELYLVELLRRYGNLYKFHDQPISFLYTTLHYYEKSLADHTPWKRNLVMAVIGAQRDLHPYSWYFTAEFSSEHMQDDAAASEKSGWNPQLSYYSKLVEKLVQGLEPFSPCSPAFVCDWHFCEFSSSLTFALYTCCVELMALPFPSSVVSNKLLLTLYEKAGGCGQNEEKIIMGWINGLALVFVSLPGCYGEVLYEAVLEVLGGHGDKDPAFLLKRIHKVVGEDSATGCLLSLLHAYLLHSNMGLLLHLPQWLSGTLRPLVRTEWQLLFVLHLLGPILNRLTGEKPKLLLEVVMEIYHLVVSVDKQQEGKFSCADVLCDFLYHIKYMHTGDHENIELLITKLNTPLKLRLQFLCSSLQDKHSNTFSQVPTPPLHPTQQTY